MAAAAAGTWGVVDVDAVVADEGVLASGAVASAGHGGCRISGLGFLAAL